MKKQKEILIFGAGGHGKVILDILLESGNKVLGFLDDNQSRIGKKINGKAILGGRSVLAKMNNVAVALGVGDNKIRAEIYKFLKKSGVPVISAIHPKAVVSAFARIGEGAVLMPQAVVNSGTILEEGVVVNTSASVDHDCYLARFSQVWPGAHLAGIVCIGEYSYVGTGAAVIQNIHIGKNVIIGAGAAVIKDIPDSVTAVGIPAKIIKTNKK